jgi:hypothetical protein
MRRNPGAGVPGRETSTTEACVIAAEERARENADTDPSEAGETDATRS